MSYTHHFRLACPEHEQPSRRARVRWLVMRHWWWLRGWCSRDGRVAYLRLAEDDE